MDSGPTILLFRICWVDLSLVFSVRAPVSFGAGGILGMESVIEVDGIVLRSTPEYEPNIIE